jgi:hydrogenase maturation protein HypF
VSEAVAPSTRTPQERRRASVRGVVQGVGFRPFVAKIARAHALVGFVRNAAEGVEIEVEGSPAALDAFACALTSPPPPARIETITWETLPSIDDDHVHVHDHDHDHDHVHDHVHADVFTIAPSLLDGAPLPTTPPDLAPCDACLAELHDPNARRHAYAFTSCTRCGPRASTILALPFDRERTTFAGFPLCPRCAAEQHDPLDRRHHAQTLACPDCGPRLLLRDRYSARLPDVDPLDAAIAELRAGAIVALRGVGGWQLLVDARDTRAVSRLRDRKRRPRQPFAVLVRDLDAARALAHVNDDEAHELTSAAAPIVLVRPRTSAVAPNVAPATPRLGLMLPSSPLHHLLASRVGAPLVCTSANLHGDPTPIGDEAFDDLRGVADLFLDHDRPIARRLDDSVRAVLAGAPRTLRLGRGLALTLPFDAPTSILATGAHFQSAPAVCDRERVYLAAHVGDLDSPRARAAHRASEDDLLALHRLEPRVVATDAHPDLACTRAAEARALPIERVWHHHAHVASVLAEHRVERALGFVLDGFGLTPHGAGGGEVLEVSPSGARFVGRLAPFPLVGVDRSAREGDRALAGVLAAAGIDVRAHVPRFAGVVDRGVPSTSAGRLFDAVSALLGVCAHSTYEGEAACALEAIALPNQPPYPFALEPKTVADPQGQPRTIVASPRGQPRTIDWRPAIAPLLAERHDAPRAAGRFHATLAVAIASFAAHHRETTQAGVRDVVLAGGCFVNALLLERTVDELDARGFRALLATQLPPGDGGLALGQLRVASWSLAART